MNPYFQIGNVTLYHGDSRELMPCFEGRTVVTDPPYNVGYHYDSYADNLGQEEYFEMLRLTMRVPSVGIHYVESLFSLSWLLEEIPEKVVAWVYNANTPRQWRAIAWFGTMAPDFSKCGQPYKNPTDRRIQALINQGKQARLYDWWNISQVKNVSEEKTEHPCQIPFEVMRRILEITPDVSIADPFAGSGTTLAAAYVAERNAIGIEQDERYCEIIARRLESLQSADNPTLFDFYPVGVAK